ncbi:MAG: rhomboid family intramembrane serine protease [Treponema sp.]|nr:rhomboid family intramembrane serine protease [Treponema sp.]
MASRKSFKFNYDAPVTNTFVLGTIFIFVLNLLIKNTDLNSMFFMCPTGASGTMPFSFSKVTDYFKLLLYVFGGTEKSILFTNLLLIMLLSPQMEELYGSVAIGIMYVIAAVFTGVLNVLFGKAPVCGADSIIFMLIVLDVLACFKSKSINCSAVVVVAVFICVQVFRQNPNGAVGIIITVAGGICGSLFAFIALPKARAKKSAAASVTSSPKRVKKQESDDATVVGTLRF